MAASASVASAGEPLPPGSEDAGVEQRARRRGQALRRAVGAAASSEGSWTRSTELGSRRSVMPPQRSGVAATRPDVALQIAQELGELAVAPSERRRERDLLAAIREQERDAVRSPSTMLFTNTTSAGWTTTRCTSIPALASAIERVRARASSCSRGPWKARPLAGDADATRLELLSFRPMDGGAGDRSPEGSSGTPGGDELAPSPRQDAMSSSILWPRGALAPAKAARDRRAAYLHPS